MRAVEIGRRALADCGKPDFWCEGEPRFVSFYGDEEERALCAHHQVQAVAGRLFFSCRLCGGEAESFDTCLDCRQDISDAEYDLMLEREVSA